MFELDSMAAYNLLKTDFAEFTKEWYIYADSGICDTEGRWACKDIVEAKMCGKPCRVTFSRLDGYDSFQKSKECPYTRREIANNMARALTKLAKAYKKAYKKYGDSLSEADFIDALW